MAKLDINKPVGFLLLMTFIFGLSQLIPWTLSLGKAGIVEPEILAQTGIYTGISFFALGVIVLWFANYLWKRNNKYGDNIGIYNKENTVFRDFTYPQMSLLSFIIFPALFLIANLSNRLGEGLFGLRVLPTQQFSATDSLLFSTAQIPPTENIMAGFALGLMILLLTMVAIKSNMKKEDFNIYRYIVATLGLGLFGYIWHLTAYPNSAVTGLIVGIFWAIGGLISIITGFFVPFLAMHMSNNFFIDFARLYTSDLALSIVILTITALAGIYVYIYGYKNNWKLFPIRWN